MQLKDAPTPTRMKFSLLLFGFYEKTSFIIGNDKKVRFWLDSWCKDDPLSVSFPKLFSIAIGKKALVDQLRDQAGEICVTSTNYVLIFVKT